jgi:hypothetical protein
VAAYWPGDCHLAGLAVWATVLTIKVGRAPRRRQMINYPSDSLGDNTNDIDRTDPDTDRQLRRCKFVLVGAPVRMAWKRSSEIEHYKPSGRAQAARHRGTVLNGATQ